MDTPPGSNNNNMSNLYELEGGRGCRNKRKQSNPTFCPVCKCTLRPTDVDQHLNCELEKLQKISKSRSIRPSISNSNGTGPGRNANNGSSSSSSGSSPPAQPNGEYYKKYKQVRNNRKSRQKAKFQRRNWITNCNNTDDRATAGPSRVLNFDESSHEDIQCPICNCFKIRTHIQDHVNTCLNLSERRRKRRRFSREPRIVIAAASSSRPDKLDESSMESSTEDDGEGEGATYADDEVDVESLTFGEYEWAGQSRVRATSLVPGGVCSIFGSSSQTGSGHVEDADEDLIVDDDDDRFGPPQYTESDMIHCESSIRREQGEETLRRAVLTPIIPSYSRIAKAPRHSGRSKSEERTENSDREAEDSNARYLSDPLPISTHTTMSAEDNRQLNIQENVLEPSDYVHMYPIIVRESGLAAENDTAVSAEGNDTAASLETMPSSQPPELIPVDMDAPVVADYDSFQSAPILQPADGSNQDRRELMIEIERLDIERFVDSSGSIQMNSEALLDLIPNLNTWNSVPSLSTIAQNVATAANITGANPGPSASGLQMSESVNKLIIKSLTDKIKDLEKRVDGDIYKCLICMDHYRTPVISTTCWHVHCEECWLRTLGVKKLCPQCNAITTPNDLRKIFI